MEIAERERSPVLVDVDRRPSQPNRESRHDFALHFREVHLIEVRSQVLACRHPAGDRSGNVEQSLVRSYEPMSSPSL